MHKGDTNGVPSKYWNGVLPSGRAVNLDSTNRIVRVPECVRALLRQTRCSDDLFLAQIVILFSRFVRVQLFCTRQ